MAEEPLPAEAEESFADSMPESYRAAFDREAIEAHAAIVARRGARIAHVEIWKELAERVVAVVVVADDRPGFLAQLSAALVAHSIDVVSANASCRTRPDGVVEAVDVLWIRRVLANGNVAPIRPRDVTRLGQLVETLVRGDSAVTPIPPPPSPSPGASTRVRFEWDASEEVMVLTVEATDRPGLLLSVTRTLFAEGLQIVGLRATTEPGPRGKGRRAIDRFSVVELDGTPLRRERLLTVQIAVLSAIEVV